jgi:hypothetical protein
MLHLQRSLQPRFAHPGTPDDREMETLQRDLKAVEQSYGQNVLSLTVARSYVRKLLENPEIKRFLNAQYADVLQEFTALVELESL